MKIFNKLAVATIMALSTCTAAVAQECITVEAINAINEEEGFVHVFDGVAIESDGSMIHTVIFTNPTDGTWIQLVSPDLTCYYIFTAGIRAEFNYSPNL